MKGWKSEREVIVRTLAPTSCVMNDGIVMVHYYRGGNFRTYYSRNAMWS